MSMISHLFNSHYNIQHIHFFIIIMCCCFTYGTQMVHVDFNLAHPQHIKLLKIDKKQGRYEFKNKMSILHKHIM